MDVILMPIPTEELGAPRISGRGRRWPGANLGFPRL